MLEHHVAAGYSTAEFLMVNEQFTSDHWMPAMVHSDRGSNLVSAAKEIDEAELDWDIIGNMSDYKTKWVFCPSGAKFCNGGFEAFVKKVKKTLYHSYGRRTKNWRLL